MVTPPKTLEAQSWNRLLEGLPSPHFLQTYEWARVKHRYGWEPLYGQWGADGSWSVAAEPSVLPAAADGTRAVALILKRRLRFGAISTPWSILYVPKGPSLDWGDSMLRARVLADLGALAKTER